MICHVYFANTPILYSCDDQTPVCYLMMTRSCRLLIHVHGHGAALLLQGNSHLERQVADLQRVQAVSRQLPWDCQHGGGGASQPLLWTPGKHVIVKIEDQVIQYRSRQHPPNNIINTEFFRTVKKTLAVFSMRSVLQHQC